MRRVTTLACVMAFVFLANALANAQPSDGYVGVYSDTSASTPCVVVPQGTAKTLYVVATLEGASASGIRGAEFRIEVANSSGWFFAPTWTAPIALGNALNEGINLGFSACHSGTNGKVLLGTVNVFNASGDSTLLLVKQHSTPTSDLYPCALFVRCDYTLRCMSQSNATCSLSKSSTTPIRIQDNAISVTSLNSSPSGGSGTPVAVFTQSATLDGKHLVKEAWSPTGGLLAYQGSDAGLYVFDAESPQEPPVLLMAEASPVVTWSPDGAWLLCQTQTPEQHRRMLASLVAVPVGGGPAVTVVSNADVGPFTWGQDGNIYWWEKCGTHLRKSAPSPVGAAQGSAVEEHYLFLRGKDLMRFQAQVVPSETVVSEIWVPGVYAVVPIQAFVDGSRHLINLYDTTRGVYSVITDVNGNIATDFGDHAAPFGFNVCSVSTDGQHVVGYYSQDDGYNYLWSKLFVGDVEGTWCVPVGGGDEGMLPTLARVGNYMAFKNVYTGDIHVGTLEITH